jgi:hypothetical protein
MGKGEDREDRLICPDANDANDPPAQLMDGVLRTDVPRNRRPAERSGV